MEGELLGDPRLKNGLTYYPAVSVRTTENGVQTAVVGNVVQLKLVLHDGQGYTGYGFLKALWLWRDEPYIRVQYLAPVQNGLPAGAIVFRQEPDVGALPELLVTDLVGDLQLNVLDSPVCIAEGPLFEQVSQQNVSKGKAKAFRCIRHLDFEAQLPRPLDAKSRVPPLTVPFGLGSLAQFACLDPLDSRFLDQVLMPSATRAMSEGRPLDQPAVEVSSNESHVHPQVDDAVSAAPDSITPPLHGHKEGVEVVGSSNLMQTNVEPTDDPSLPHTVLKATLVPSFPRRVEHVRFPGNLIALRALVADVFGLWEPSLRLEHQHSSKRWRELTSTTEVYTILKQADLKKGEFISLRARGPPRQNIAFDVCSVLLVASSLTASFLLSTIVLLPATKLQFNTQEVLPVAIIALLSMVPFGTFLCHLGFCLLFIGREYMRNQVP